MIIKNNILKNKISRRSDFGVWRRFGNSKKIMIKKENDKKRDD